MRVVLFALGVVFLVSAGEIRSEGVPTPGDDPSSVPALRGDGDRDQRFRALVDLNRDGVQDLLLSHGISLFGNSGGLFDLFLAEPDGSYRAIGRIHLHPRMVSLEEAPEATRIWTYGRLNAQSGTLGYYEVREDELSEHRGLPINPGDGGTALGNAIAEAAFDDAYRIRFERSRGLAQEVIWAAE